MLPQTTETPSPPEQALLHALQDLTANGVTDLVSDTPTVWLDSPALGKSPARKISEPAPQSPPLAAQPQQQHAPARTAQPIAPRQAEPKPKPITTPAPDPVPAAQQAAPFQTWQVGTGTRLMLVAPAFTHHAQGSLPFTAEEQTLLTNMLKAIGLSLEDITISCCIMGEDANQPYTLAQTEAFAAPLKAAFASSHTLLFLGPLVAQALHQQEASLTDLKAQTTTLLPQKHCGFTYHPRILLKQPTLKRVAWQDLLALHLHLKGLEKE